MGALETGSGATGAVDADLHAKTKMAIVHINMIFFIFLILKLIWSKDTYQIL